MDELAINPRGELVPIKDNAAGALLGGVSRSTVYDLVDQKKLVKVRIGARSFITRASIDDYISRLTAAASA